MSGLLFIATFNRPTVKGSGWVVFFLGYERAKEKYKKRIITFNPLVVVARAKMRSPISVIDNISIHALLPQFERAQRSGKV